MKLQLGTKIHTHVQNFHKFFKEGNINWLLAGRELIELKRLECWRKDGSEARSWREWTDKALLISGTTADRLIRISEKYGEVLESNPVYADVDPTKLDLIPSSINGREQLLEWIEKARNLSVRALKDECADFSGGVASDTCLHLEVRTVSICKKCGRKVINDNAPG
jgi:hypothetical protein